MVNLKMLDVFSDNLSNITIFLYIKRGMIMMYFTMFDSIALESWLGMNREREIIWNQIQKENMVI